MVSISTKATHLSAKDDRNDNRQYKSTYFLMRTFKGMDHKTPCTDHV